MDLLLFLGMNGPAEIMLIFLAILLLFGGKKIPELMRGLGRGIREFNDARSKVSDEIREGMREEKKELPANKREEAPRTEVKEPIKNETTKTE